MKTKRLLYIASFLLILGLNFNFSTRSSDALKNLSLTFLQNQASAQIEACVSITYFSDDMKPCFNSQPCYKQGEQCGEERCCEYSKLGSRCNETVCSY
jgi:hypothetical protein